MLMFLSVTMAADQSFYCTGIITGSDGDGDGTVGTPYQGPVGLQKALDEGDGFENTFIYIRDAYDLDVGNDGDGIIITVDSNETSDPFWKSVIGSTGSGVTWTPITTQGTYVTFIAGNGSGGMDGNSMFSIDSHDNFQMENVCVKDPGGTGNNATSGEDGFSMTASSATFGPVLRNCKADNCHTGFNESSTNIRGAAYINCAVTNGDEESMRLEGLMSRVIGGIFTTSVADDNIFSGQFSSFHGVILVGGTNGINSSGQYGSLIMNCSIIGQTNACVRVGSANANHVILNNVFDVVDTAADKAIEIAAGTIYEDYNITDADTAILSGFTSPTTNSVFNLTFTDTDPFISISAANYKPNRGQTVCDTNLLDQGFVSYVGSGTTGGWSSIGGFSVGDLPAVAGTLDSDTVMGTTGTASEGGGGAPHVTNKSGGKQ
jgi:hypothetical protein